MLVGDSEVTWEQGEYLECLLNNKQMIKVMSESAGKWIWVSTEDRKYRTWIVYLRISEGGITCG